MANNLCLAYGLWTGKPGRNYSRSGQDTHLVPGLETWNSYYIIICIGSTHGRMSGRGIPVTQHGIDSGTAFPGGH
jgi:hypothetical protein